MPLLPEASRAWSGDEPEVRSYRARDHAVAAFAFDASADLGSVSEYVSALIRAFCPKDGLRVRAARGDRVEVLGSRFTPTATISKSQLARGGTLELSHQHFGPVNGRCAQPLFWLSSRATTPDDDDLVALQFGLCVARPGADAAQRAIAHALHTFAESIVELGGCVSVVVTAQGAPTALASPTLAYEELAGTASHASSAAWLREHVRAPGWRVLVPKARARGVSRSVPAGVVLERVRCGMLAQHEAPTPWAVEGTETMERWLLPLLA